MTEEEIREELERLRLENKQLKAGKYSISISEKGCVALYGIRRFPITLYKNEWEELFETISKVKQFIKSNPQLKTVKNTYREK
jgi:uncharacterized protein YlxP (DUF503 family)